MQHRKCPSFDAFQTLFGQSPNCKPVDPQEVGGLEAEDDGMDEDADDDSVTTPGTAASVFFSAPIAVAPMAAIAAVAVAASGKQAAAFHLAPSKKVPLPHHLHHNSLCTPSSPASPQAVKLDLGEAYLKAQQLRIDSVAVTANTKARCDLVIAMMKQKKSAEEIALMVRLAGL
jgi:hypothetical protein